MLTKFYIIQLLHILLLNYIYILQSNSIIYFNLIDCVYIVNIINIL